MIAKDEVIKALEVLVAYCEQYKADMSGTCCIPYTKDYPRSCVFWDYCYYHECSVCEKMRTILIKGVKR